MKWFQSLKEASEAYVPENVNVMVGVVKRYAIPNFK